MRAVKTNVFDTITDKYDSWYDSDEGKLLYECELLCLKPMVENCLPPILEIGVGTGRFAQWFPGAIGIDPAFNALKFAQKRGVKVIQAVGEMLPFRNELFSCVMLIVTLCFVQRPIDVLREAKRVLKKDGRIIIGLIPKDSPWGSFYEKKNGSLFYSAARFYSFKDVKKMMHKVGLKNSMIKSTLLQRPNEDRRTENPAKGFVKRTGFLCIKAKKQERKT
jgi:ubiquinone/menaquinone biosynthesis C-methylase UbiE